MKLIADYSWILILIVGLLMLVFAIDNIVFIPGIDPADPERGWTWLTTDPEVVAFLKYQYRLFGFGILALSMFVMTTAATGFRNRERGAWWAMLYLPVHIAIHLYYWPWTAPILIPLLLITIVAIALPYRLFFPARPE